MVPYWMIVEAPGGPQQPDRPWRGARWAVLDEDGDCWTTFRTFNEALRFVVVDLTGLLPKGWKRNEQCGECHCHL